MESYNLLIEQPQPTSPMKQSKKYQTIFSRKPLAVRLTFLCKGGARLGLTTTRVSISPLCSTSEFPSFCPRVRRVPHRCEGLRRQPVGQHQSRSGARDSPSNAPKFESAFEGRRLPTGSGAFPFSDMLSSTLVYRRLLRRPWFPWSRFQEVHPAPLKSLTPMNNYLKYRREYPAY